MELKSTISEIVSKHLPDDSHFLVDVLIGQKNGGTLVKVLIDADQGVKIDTCAKISRIVGEEIEAKEIIAQAYILEVSSPGLDLPLTSRRQYQKNIGRSLKVTMEDGKTLEGVLLGLDQTQIVLKVKVKEKGKKATEEEVKLPLDQIKKSIVLVSFK